MSRLTTVATFDLAANAVGVGRELFASMRLHASSAELGACSLFVDNDPSEPS